MFKLKFNRPIKKFPSEMVENVNWPRNIDGWLSKFLIPHTILFEYVHI